MKKRTPKTPGALADKYYSTRQERLALQKQVDELKRYESSLKNKIIDTLPISDQTGAQGDQARITVMLKERVIVEDQELFRQYLNETKRWDLANNIQASAPGIKELWEDGEEIPGVGKFQYKDVSLNKV